ncbi:reverse transcriptase domain-containing protein [Tanacetum coccineum]
MLATRGSGKVTTMEARANKTKGIRGLEHTLLSQATRKSMLETYHCNKYKFHHNGLCLAKCGNCKRVGHQIGDYRTLAPKAKPRPSMVKQKDEFTCHECGNMGHYERKCPLLKFLNHVDKY